MNDRSTAERDNTAHQRSAAQQRSAVGRDRVEASGALDRRSATMREVRAQAHPLRLRILRLCWQREMTNKQLADQLDRDPGTVRYHVRQLVGVGLLEEGPVRHGEHGALEKPYRAKVRTWWLDDPPGVGADSAFAPLDAVRDELRASGPDSVRTFARFAVHLSPEDAAELDRRILAILDEYLSTDDQRLDEPAYGGLMVLHRLAATEPAPDGPTGVVTDGGSRSEHR